MTAERTMIGLSREPKIIAQYILCVLVDLYINILLLLFALLLANKHTYCAHASTSN